MFGFKRLSARCFAAAIASLLSVSMGGSDRLAAAESGPLLVDPQAPATTPADHPTSKRPAAARSVLKRPVAAEVDPDAAAQLLQEDRAKMSRKLDAAENDAASQPATVDKAQDGVTADEPAEQTPAEVDPIAGARLVDQARAKMDAKLEQAEDQAAAQSRTGELDAEQDDAGIAPSANSTEEAAMDVRPITPAASDSNDIADIQVAPSEAEDLPEPASVGRAREPAIDVEATDAYREAPEQPVLPPPRPRATAVAPRNERTPRQVSAPRATAERDLSADLIEDTQSPAERQLRAARERIWVLLGVVIDSRHPNEAVVEQVYPGSVGDETGLQVGDAIVSVNGTEVATPEELAAALARATSMRDVQLEVARRVTRRIGRTASDARDADSVVVAPRRSERAGLGASVETRYRLTPEEPLSSDPEFGAGSAFVPERSEAELQIDARRQRELDYERAQYERERELLARERELAREEQERRADRARGDTRRPILRGLFRRR